MAALIALGVLLVLFTLAGVLIPIYFFCGELLPKTFHFWGSRLWHYLKKLFEDKANTQKENFKKAGENQKKESEQRLHDLIKRNSDLINKFLAIAERKVSSLDEYGDENWEVFPAEIVSCLKKIAQREGRTIDWRETQKRIRNGNSTYSWWMLPEDFRWIAAQLDQRFQEHHQNMKAGSTANTFEDLTGVEFETRIANILKQHGFLDVAGTPITGDQGADLIVKINGKAIVIQAKRYQGLVGTKAVQEVIAARHFYSADEAWVITNSSFTPLAKDLAQKSRVALIDGQDLQHTLGTS